MGRQYLDGDDAVEPLVLRAVNLTHPPRPEEGQDLVGPELGACFERHAAAQGRHSIATTLPRLMRRRRNSVRRMLLPAVQILPPLPTSYKASSRSGLRERP